MCVVCGQDPCEYAVTPKLKPVVSKRKVKAVKEITKSKPRINDEDLLMVSALQALQPLLHAESLEFHKELLAIELDSNQRARVWRARNVN